MVQVVIVIIIIYCNNNYNAKYWAIVRQKSSKPQWDPYYRGTTVKVFSQSINHIIHPFCLVVGIGHVNSLHGFKSTHVITYLFKYAYEIHFAHLQSQLNYIHNM